MLDAALDESVFPPLEEVLESPVLSVVAEPVPL
jgi:hypothetical protein